MDLKKPPVLAMAARAAARSISRGPLPLASAASDALPAALYRQIVEVSANGILVLDAAARVRFANAGMATLTGYPVTSIQDRPLGDFLVAASGDELLRLSLTGNRERAVKFRRADGSYLWTLCTFSTLTDTSGKSLGTLVVITDITAHEQAEEALRASDHRYAQERIHYLASYDPLTGLANRRLFNERLHADLTADQNGGTVLLLDLDRFKTINESLGHAAGDELLRAIALRLTKYLRPEDTLAHLGGDEFALLLPGLVVLKEVETLAEILLVAVAEPVRLGEREFIVSGSMGVALYPRDGSDALEVLSHADVALYRAKAEGRNTYKLYAQHPHKAALDQLDLERELRRAIERQEFVLHYQPQIDIHSGLIVGVEALVRWNHGTLGVVTPAQFIPLAEETGLIAPLSEWILSEACRQGRVWRDANLGRLRIAVNMSGFSFKTGGPKQRNIARVIADILAHSGFAAENLEIELTESMLMHDVAQTVQTLGDLSALGVHIAIDDFGIGYSSLNYLRRFPIDVLKIDQSFVGDLTRDPNDAAIVSAIIQLAHTLELCVVAEGVETATQLQFLRDRRCDLYQGFLAARPLPADVFAAHMHAQNTRLA